MSVQTSSIADQAPDLRRKLLSWWQVYGRHDIPWKRSAKGVLPKRGEELHPYPIWVAEVMLQQTQLQVVLPYWQRWMERFPTLQSLAAAHEQEVLLLWPVSYTHLTLPTIYSV